MANHNVRARDGIRQYAEYLSLQTFTHRSTSGAACLQTRPAAPIWVRRPTPSPANLRVESPSVRGAHSAVADTCRGWPSGELHHPSAHTRPGGCSGSRAPTSHPSGRAMGCYAVEQRLGDLGLSHPEALRCYAPLLNIGRPQCSLPYAAGGVMTTDVSPLRSRRRSP